MAGNIPQTDHHDDNDNMVYAEEVIEEPSDERFYDTLLNGGGCEFPNDLPPAQKKKYEQLTDFLARCNPDQISSLRKHHATPPPVPALVNDPQRSLRMVDRVGAQNPPTGSTPASSMATSDDGNALLINNDEVFSNYDEEVQEVRRKPANNQQQQNFAPANTGRGRGGKQGAHKRSAQGAGRGRGTPPFKAPFLPANKGNTQQHTIQQQPAQQSSSIVSVNVHTPPPQQSGAGPSKQPPTSNSFANYQEIIPAAAEKRIIPILLKGIASYNANRGDVAGSGGKTCHFFNGQNNSPCSNKQLYDEDLDTYFCKDNNGNKHLHSCRLCFNLLHTCYNHKIKDCAIAQFLRSNDIEFH